jgi:hypothetical protein
VPAALHAQVAVGRLHDGYDGDGGCLFTDGPSIVGRERVTTTQTVRDPAGEQEARLEGAHVDRVLAERLDTRAERPLEAVDECRHGDDGGDPDDDAEQRQPRAQSVRA